MILQDVRGVKLLIPPDEAKRFHSLLAQNKDPEAILHSITTDTNGLITSFSPPPQATTWGFIFFIQNLMIAQRLALMDDFLKTNGVIK